ncbi:hypothetical protein F2Q70_00025307 [Brassica cretica]|uniref:Uncharacterized protein n=2 Tax=Brassica cretica TaxID=69181 RepID=A0A8S9LH17_BRACR|nr:hypothetical protein F2Q70_00025307 [Brassica cretica]
MGSWGRMRMIECNEVIMVKEKGKMFEENDTKWVRVPERGSKRSFPHRSTNRGDEGNSMHRSSRWERSRSIILLKHLSFSSNSHEDRGRHYTRRERRPLRAVREDVFEEGEIKSNLKSTQCTAREEEEKMIKVASPAKERQLSPVNASDAEVINKPLVIEDGLDLVNGYLEDGTKAVEEDGMEMEEEQMMEDGNDKQVDLDDEFQSLTDGEEKEKMQDKGDDIREEDSVIVSGAAMEEGAGDAEKKVCSRKQLFVSTAGGAANKKFVQVLLSPRKRTNVKQNPRKTGGSKQVEAKGPLHPKPFTKP